MSQIYLEILLDFIRFFFFFQLSDFGLFALCTLAKAIRWKKVQLISTNRIYPVFEVDNLYITRLGSALSNKLIEISVLGIR